MKSFSSLIELSMWYRNSVFYSIASTCWSSLDFIKLITKQSPLDIVFQKGAKGAALQRRFGACLTSLVTLSQSRELRRPCCHCWRRELHYRGGLEPPRAVPGDLLSLQGVMLPKEVGSCTTSEPWESLRSLLWVVGDSPGLQPPRTELRRFWACLGHTWWPSFDEGALLPE